MSIFPQGSTKLCDKTHLCKLKMIHKCNEMRGKMTERTGPSEFLVQRLSWPHAQKHSHRCGEFGMNTHKLIQMMQIENLLCFLCEHRIEYFPCKLHIQIVRINHKLGDIMENLKSWNPICCLNMSALLGFYVGLDCNPASKCRKLIYSNEVILVLSTIHSSLFSLFLSASKLFSFMCCWFVCSV